MAAIKSLRLPAQGQSAQGDESVFVHPCVCKVPESRYSAGERKMN